MAQWAENVLGPTSLLALLVAAVLTVVVLRRFGDADEAWTRSLERRFVAGVPWGTVIVVGFVLFVYVVVQGAWGSLSDPLVVPFRSWSYTYPLGMLTAAFAHVSLGHVTGNLLSTVVFAPLVEYAWGHYPTERASNRDASDDANSLLDRPAGRIGAFVAAVLLVGLATSLFVPGPSVGFSGVVFAFAGVALVVAPLRAVVAIVGVRVVRTLYYAVVDPVPVATARTQYVQPWFADISVQGHAFGLVVGILVGLLVLARDDRTPPLRHVWLATLGFAVMESLWALYWYRGAQSVQLFRATGVALVLVLAAVVVAAVSVGVGLPDRWHEATRWRHLQSALSLKHLPLVILLVFVLGIGVAAVPHHLADVDDVPDEDAVEVRDYTVFYAEDVPHGYAAAVPLPWIGDDLASSARASGVIVASERRNAWEEVVPAARLALDGRATVSVGGLGWRERVVANRTAWDAIGAGETYTVFLDPPEGERVVADTAPPVGLAPQIAGANLTIYPTAAGYDLNVTRNGTAVGRVPVPAANETASVAGFEVTRRDDALIAVTDGTRIPLAWYERAGDRNRR